MVTGHRPQHLHPDTWDWIEGELDRIAYKLRDEHRTLTPPIEAGQLTRILLESVDQELTRRNGGTP
jgi:hypothetical protein